MSRESIVRFGDDGSLVGILTEPDGGAQIDRPAFFLLNVGVVHRVGPSRVNVNLARTLAAAGFVAVRFDVSGLGDSGVRSDGLPYHRSRMAETLEAMDRLTASHGLSTFVFVGICSGADHAFRVACADRRVVGVLMVDGYVYPTRRAKLHFFLGRLFRARSWVRLITGESVLWRMFAKRDGQRSLARTAAEGEGFVVDAPTRDDAEARLRALIDRGVDFFLVFTAAAQPTYAYRKQFWDMFPKLEPGSYLRIEFWEDTGHTFQQLSRQRGFLRSVSEWATSCWPPPETLPEARVAHGKLEATTTLATS